MDHIDDTQCIYFVRMIMVLSLQFYPLLYIRMKRHCTYIIYIKLILYHKPYIYKVICQIIIYISYIKLIVDIIYVSQMCGACSVYNINKKYAYLNCFLVEVN